MKLIDAKEVRFRKAARLLTGEMGIKMLIEKNPQGAPASYNLDSKLMVLNDSVPTIKGDRVKSLAFDRAKLFHECGHVKWTRDASGLRGELAKKSRDAQAFLDVSNILEDGRIEWLMSHRWHGAAAYLKLLFGHFLGEVLGDERADNLNGLAFYVRALKWRNAREAAFWKPVVAEIGKGIRSKSTHEVCRVAFEIVEKLFPAAPSPDKPQGNAQGDAQGGEGKGEPSNGAPEPQEPQGGDSGDSGEGSSDESEDDSESKSEGAEDSEDDSEAASGNGGGDSDEDGGEDSAQGSGGKEKDGISEDVRKAVEQAIKETLKSVKEEVAEELEEILALMDTPEAQQFQGGEESEAEAVSHILASIQTERQRTTYLPSRKSGRIDARRIVGVVSGDSFLTRRQEANGPINVAFCIDASSSMKGAVYVGGERKTRIDIATGCARILNGALQKARINSVGIKYGNGEATRHPNIALGSMNASGGTPTHLAMEAARLWLGEQQPEGGKGIILIVTDGCPDSFPSCELEFQKANEAGYVVVCIAICSTSKPNGKYFHDSGNVENPNGLARMLEDKLIGAMGMV